jgi:hypothetical protein
LTFDQWGTEPVSGLGRDSSPVGETAGKPAKSSLSEMKGFLFSLKHFTNILPKHTFCVFLSGGTLPYFYQNHGKENIPCQHFQRWY